VSDVDRTELAGRLDDPELTILDVRSAAEFTGARGAHCDPRQGHITGARNLDLQELMTLTAAELEARLGVAPGAEIAAYCHSGSRSALAVGILRAAGYDARNYVGSWHEWSRDESLPIDAG
jgi:thiosulfate/3-mercaptopyruvate sulfurtransferase